MPNEDLRGFSERQLAIELGRLYSEQQTLESELEHLLQLSRGGARARFNRRIDLGIGLVATIGGFAAMSVTVVGIAGVFLGAVGLYRSGLAHFKAAADDDGLAARIDGVRLKIAATLERAEAAERALPRL